MGDEGLLEARMKPQPWWEKKHDLPDESEVRIRKHVEALGVKHLVFGHQPGGYSFSDGTRRPKGTMFQKFNALVLLIDVGMSRGIDEDGEGYSQGVLLRIHRAGHDESATAIYPDGKRRQLWPSEMKERSEALRFSRGEKGVAPGVTLSFSGEHMAQVSVAVGQPVSRGDRLGTVRSTGESKALHIQFEERVHRTVRREESQCSEHSGGSDDSKLPARRQGRSRRSCHPEVDFEGHDGPPADCQGRPTRQFS
jgi:hypothetical protein